MANKSNVTSRLWFFCGLALALQVSGFARADDKIEGVYMALQNGVAPTLSGTDFDSAKQKLIGQIKDFRQDFLNESNRVSPSANCRRYSSAVAVTTLQLEESLYALNSSDAVSEAPDTGFLNLVRLHLLTPAFFDLYSLFAHSSEGGFGTVNVNDKVTCIFPNREAIQSAFLGLAQQLASFHLQAVGNPGLLGFDRISDRLFTIADQNAESRTRFSWGLIALTTATSFYFWEVAPIAGKMVAQRLFSLSPALLNRPAFVFSVRTGTLTAEGVGYHVLDRALLPPEDPRSEERTPIASWDEHLEELENLTSSPLNAAELYLAYLGQIKAQLARLYLPWLEHNISELKALPNSQLTEILGLAKEYLTLSSAPLGRAAQLLTALIQRDYGYKLRCYSGWMGGLSDLQCLQGVRAFARAIYSGELPKLGGAAVPILNLTVAKSSGAVVNSEETIDITLPYWGGEKDMTVAVLPVLYGDQLRKRISEQQRFTDAKEVLEANINIPVTFDPELSKYKKWTALNNLMALAKTEKEVFNDCAEALYVTQKFGVGEEELRLQVNIAATASLLDLKDFLSQRPTDPRVIKITQSIHGYREKIQKVKDAIKAQTGLSSECSSAFNLRLFECLRGLTEIKRYFDAHPDFQPEANTIFIVGRDEMASFFDTFVTNGSRVFALNWDFYPFNLRQFSKEKGWSP